MENSKTIASALARAQLKMGAALKTSTNPHFKSKYADLSSVIDACLDVMNEENIAVIQPMGVGEGGDRYVDTVFIHGDSGESLSCRVPLIVQKQDMQGLGSAITYARRYGLMSMAGIAPEDDDGTQAVKAAPKPPSIAAVKAATEAINGADTLEALKAAFIVLSDDLKAAVLSDKDKRKAELERPVVDLSDDQIPY